MTLKKKLSRHLDRRSYTWSDETSFAAGRQVFEEATSEMREPGEELVQEHHVVAAVLAADFLLA